MTVKAVALQPVQLYAAPFYPGQPGSKFRVTNLDELNTIYLDSIVGVDAGSTPLPPQATVTYAGNRDVWASSLSSTLVLVDVDDDSLTWDNPVGVQIALNALGLATRAEQITQNTAIPANIATTGVPLLNAPDLLDSISPASPLVIAHGATSLRGNFTVTQPAYDIVIECEIAAGSTLPWLQVELSWLDNATSLDIMTDTFYLVCTNNGANVFGGRGQSKGDMVGVSFTNLDTAESITLSYSITQHSRIPPRDDWRQEAFNGGAGMTTAPCDPPSLLLASWEPVIGGPGNAAIVLPMWSGKARLTLSEAPIACRVVVKNPGPPATGLVTGNVIYDSGAVAASGVVDAEVSLGRGNSQVELLNTGASSETFQLLVIAEEY